MVQKQSTKNGYRSGLERSVASNLKRRNIAVVYEPFKIEYVLEKTYTPDFELPNKILVEVKGRLRPEDRTKMIAVRDQNPSLDIRFLFANAENKLHKGSKMTYREWAERNNFKWAEGTSIPQRWVEE